jgi:hypothetical protein
MPRYRDPSRDVGNLMPGEMLFRPEPVETFPMNPYSWDELMALHRTRNTFRGAAPAAVRIAPYRTRSLRRS